MGQLVREEESGEPGGGGGGGDTTTMTDSSKGPLIPDNWREALPEDLQKDPTLQNLKPGKEGFTSLAKTLVESQKMLGQPKVSIPKPDASQAEWEAFYNAGGRPETVDGYKIEIPELKNIQVDDEKLAEWKKFFHASGLNNKQANDIMSRYLSTMDEQQGSVQQQQQTQIAQKLGELKEEWGESFDSNVEIAKAALRKFASEGFIEFLNNTKLGDHPDMIKVFHQIGEGLIDDDTAGRGSGMIVSSPTRAKREIELLKQDEDFLKAYTNRQHPGHKAARARMEELQRTASEQ